MAAAHELITEEAVSDDDKMTTGVGVGWGARGVGWGEGVGVLNKRENGCVEQINAQYEKKGVSQVSCEAGTQQES